jgi:hypothetical protein
MYDRKKITLFVLLIATVLLGGVSLFLATQINQNQSPDDSQAGTVSCTPMYSDAGVACVGNTEIECEGQNKFPIPTGRCCEVTPSKTCIPRTNTNLSYCSQVPCGGIYDGTVESCINNTVTITACEFKVIDSPTPTTCSFGGSTIALNQTACDSGNKEYKCVTAGQAAVFQNKCCNNKIWNGTSCVSPTPVDPSDPSSCSVQGTTITHGGEACVGGRVYECNDGTPTNIGPCTTGGTSGGGTASCSQSGEIISHGNTACINGTNYTCSNGTATAGSSCSTDPVTPPTQPGGSTGSTCTPTAPVKAKLTGPGNNAVINSNTVTLTWDRNGSWGVGCPENINQFRVRVAVVGVSEACPTDTSLGSYSRVGVVEGGPTGAFNLTVEDDKKYCWLIRKNNSDVSTDSGVRSFTVNIEEEEVDPGVDEDLTPGGEEIIDEEVVVVTQSGGGVPTGDATALPDTAIVSDELDPILLGMVLVIIGLTLYKFDFGKKREVE